jgi:cell division protein FtsQ
MRRSSRVTPSRLAPQRLTKKEPFWQARRRNAYRRSRRGGDGPPAGAWRRFCLATLGLTGLAGLSLGLLLLYYQLLTCSWFCIKDIKNIKIDGTHRLTHEYILEQTGLGPNTSLLALRPARLERILLSHPWIARAEVTRKWPHQLVIRLQEREPVALVQLGELYYVDRQGTLFKPLNPGDPHDFPVITGLGKEQFIQKEERPEIVTQVFALLELLKQAHPPLNLENVAEVHVDLERGFTLYANGLKGAVDLGLTGFPEKLSKFERIFPILSQKGYLHRVERINLDFPQKVLLTQRGGTEEKSEKP